jgi:hypothetical protein
MARPSYARSEEPRREPLPPELRTVGQLVAESMRMYGARFGWAILLGLPLAAVDQAAHGLSREGSTVALLAASPLFTLAYAAATLIAGRPRPPLGAWAVALVAGTLVFLPAAATFPWFALAAVAWLGLAGLVVPVAMVERLGVLATLRRGIHLGRVDPVHAIGSLATLVLLFGFLRIGLGVLLQSQAELAVRPTIFLADLVLSPVLYLGACVLYTDQEARDRLGTKRGGRAR